MEDGAKRRVVGFGDKQSILCREAPLTETQGSQENAFDHSRGELRETGEQNIFKIMKKGSSALKSLFKEKHNMNKRG